MSELEQAIKLNQESKQFRDEAREALNESRELLNKTTRFNEQANINQRRIALAVSSLLPKSLRNEFNLNASDIENTAEIARNNVVAIEQRDIFDIVHAINVLAMANTDVIHIFTSFSAHVRKFDVHALAADTCYQSETHHRLMDEHVWLGDEGTLEKLLSIESQLTELIIQVREEAEAKAEVGA